MNARDPIEEDFEQPWPFTFREVVARALCVIGMGFVVVLLAGFVSRIGHVGR